MQQLKGRTHICFECGSLNIDYDPVHESRYCRECGTVLDETAFE